MYDLIRQDQAYHLFADGRSLLGFVNAADTLSSAAFFIAGTLGLIFLWRERTSGSRHFVVPEEMRAYWVLFCAVTLTGFGSAYYHMAPDDARLMWDRLPMSLRLHGLAGGDDRRAHPPDLGSPAAVSPGSIGGGSVLSGAGAPCTAGESAALCRRPVRFDRCHPCHCHLVPLALYAWTLYLRRAGDLCGGQGCRGARCADLRLGQIVSGHTLKHLLAGLPSAGCCGCCRCAGRNK